MEGDGGDGSSKELLFLVVISVVVMVVVVIIVMEENFFFVRLQFIVVGLVKEVVQFFYVCFYQGCLFIFYQLQFYNDEDFKVSFFNVFDQGIILGLRGVGFLGFLGFGVIMELYGFSLMFWVLGFVNYLIRVFVD